VKSFADPAGHLPQRETPEALLDLLAPVIGQA
jgi:hypothetical protein